MKRQAVLFWLLMFGIAFAVHGQTQSNAIKEISCTLGKMTAGTVYTGVLSPIPILDASRQAQGTSSSSSFYGAPFFLSEKTTQGAVSSSGDFYIDYARGYYYVKAGASGTPQVSYSVRRTDDLNSYTMAVDTVRFTRPAVNAIAYTAGDIIGQSLTASQCRLVELPNAARIAGGYGYIKSIAVTVDTALTSGAIMALFYDDSTGQTMIADNAAFTQPFAFWPKHIDNVTLTFTGNGTATAASSFASSSALSIPYKTISTSTSLWMRVTCATGFTPGIGMSLAFIVKYERPAEKPQ